MLLNLCVNPSGSGSDTMFGSRKPISRKVVVLGDGASGKTSLLHVHARGHFPQVYEPTVFENHIQETIVDDQIIELALWDTAGQEEFDRLRSLSYADTHVIMLCFSVDQPTSLGNTESKPSSGWMKSLSTALALKFVWLL